jgi:hypothetical protein
LEIDVYVPEGIPEKFIRIVEENVNTLKLKSHGFEDGIVNLPTMKRD